MSGKNLILYYTWVGNTKVVAEEIQRQTGFKMLQITERKERQKNKIMGSAMSAFLGFGSRLNPMDYSFSGYEGLYLGAQVWAGKTTPAINTFLRKAQLKDKRVWLFLTKADDKVSQKVIDSISARIAKRGGTLVDTLSITAPWDPRNPTILSPETIKDQVRNWLQQHD